MSVFSGGGSTKKLLAEISSKQDLILMKLSELAASLTQVGDKLDQARAEILALLEQLAQADPDLSPEGQQAVDRLKVIAEALDAIVPDEQPPPEEARAKR